MSILNQYPYINLNDLNLDWILKHMKEVIAKIGELDDWREQHEAEYQELKDLYDAVMSGNFPPSITNAFERWFTNNALDLVGAMVKHVYFGLTDDGYFCAFIPENWSDIRFDTITDSDNPLYGHLLLMYD